MIVELEVKEFLDKIRKSKDSLLIDARSPAEFKESHIKDAINLYSLDNNQRAEVGTLYKKSPFKAKMLGAALISANISRYLQNELKELTPKTELFIYCSRGGQRSGAFATILSAIGFRVYKLKGGYKSYRNFVVKYLDNFEYDNFIVLDGLTGSGKSEIIRELDNAIDLEALANHYGSSFGGVNGSQPSQKQFQNSLFDELERVKKYSVTFLEGESKKIGKLHIPSRLYDKMLNSPHVWIESPLEERAKRIVKDYQGIDTIFFEESLKKIKPYIYKEHLAKAREAFCMDDLYRCAYILLDKYYDRVYKRRGGYIVTIKHKETIKIVKKLQELNLIDTLKILF